MKARCKIWSSIDIQILLNIANYNNPLFNSYKDIVDMKIIFSSTLFINEFLEIQFWKCSWNFKQPVNFKQSRYSSLICSFPSQYWGHEISLFGGTRLNWLHLVASAQPVRCTDESVMTKIIHFFTSRRGLLMEFEPRYFGLQYFWYSGVCLYLFY